MEIACHILEGQFLSGKSLCENQSFTCHFKHLIHIIFSEMKKIYLYLKNHTFSQLPISYSIVPVSNQLMVITLSFLKNHLSFFFWKFISILRLVCSLLSSLNIHFLKQILSLLKTQDSGCQL